MEQTSSMERSAAWAGCSHTRWFLAVFYAIAIAWGVRSIWRGMFSLVDSIVPFALAVGLGTWAIVDARHRGRPIPFLAQPWFILFGFAVPLYVVWSRRWRGLGWVILHGAGWCVVSMMSAMAFGSLIYGQQWFSALW